MKLRMLVRPHDPKAYDTDWTYPYGAGRKPSSGGSDAPLGCGLKEG